MAGLGRSGKCRARRCFRACAMSMRCIGRCSFSRAAKKLFILSPRSAMPCVKPSSGSARRSFDRSTNPIGLTDLGKEYIRAVELILDVENGFVNYLHDRNALQTVRFHRWDQCLYLLCAAALGLAVHGAISADSHRTCGGCDLGTEDRLSDGSLDLLIDNTELNAAAYEKKFFREGALAAHRAAGARGQRARPELCAHGGGNQAEPRI